MSTTTSIPFFTLRPQYTQLKKPIQHALDRVFERQHFILGEEGEQFEKEFATYIGTRFCVGVNSGTDALRLSLYALGIGTGDEVITQPNSFVATALAITETGATPVFADVNAETAQIDPSRIEAAITSRTKAIIPVHLYGTPAPMRYIRDIATRHHIPIIEDACQAHGASYQEQKLGSWGTLGTFSFYPTKNLGGYGDGGAICTNDPSLNELLRKLRNYGQTKKYYHERWGANSRLDELQAAVLRVKLPYVPTWNTQRKQKYELYQQLLPNTVRLIPTDPDGVSSYHICAVETAHRDSLHKFLKTHGIETLIHYPVPIHLQKCYKFLGHAAGDFPQAEQLAKNILSLPLYPEIQDTHVEKIATAVTSFFQSY